MKKSQKMWIVVLGAAILLSMAVCFAATPGKSYHIGYTVMDLTNPIWAETAEQCKKIAKEKGWTITVVDCDSNASKQISQMENFIAEKVDGIVINPADATALTDVVKEARKNGIKILSYDVQMSDSDGEYLVNNYDLGQKIGAEAAKWINKKLNGEAEVAVIDYPKIPDIIKRAQGIRDAIKKDAPKAKIVAEASAATAQEGITITENFLQAHPNIKVIASIGDGGAIGANEAVKAAGKNTADFGIFSADGTDEALSKIKNNESIRMTIQLDTPQGKAKDIMGLTEKMLKGGTYTKVVYTGQIAIDKSNLSAFYKK
jgi:ribose transport system substrate-binding protein